MEGKISLAGTLTARRGRLMDDRFYVLTKAPLLWKVRNALRWSYIKGQLAWHIGRPLARSFGLTTLIGELRIRHFKRRDGVCVDYGVVGRRMVTTAFCVYAVDQMQTETSTWGDFKYHDSGIGTTDPAVGDTDIESSDGEARVTGSQTEGTSVQYKSVGTISYTTTKAITEWGLFNASTGPTLLDRDEFGAINVVSGDSCEFSYLLSYTAGG